MEENHVKFFSSFFFWNTVSKVAKKCVTKSLMQCTTGHVPAAVAPFLFCRALALETIPTICYKSVTLCCLAWEKNVAQFWHLLWTTIIDTWQALQVCLTQWPLVEAVQQTKCDKIFASWVVMLSFFHFFPLIHPLPLLSFIPCPCCRSSLALAVKVATPNTRAIPAVAAASVTSLFKSQTPPGGSGSASGAGGHSLHCPHLFPACSTS